MRPSKLPSVRVEPEVVTLDGGLDLISPPGQSRPGRCRFALNYEAEFGGGYARVGGFERFSGKPSPYLAVYVVLEADAGYTGASVGAVVDGDTSTAQGTVIWLSDDMKRIALSKLSGPEFTEEVLKVGMTTIGTVTNASPAIDPFLDNDLAYLAGELYRADISKPPGDGPTRGVAIIDNKVFAWRDDGANQKLYEATAAGWALVSLKFRVSFTAGSSEYVDGETLTQGGVSATILRAVTVSGSWSGGTAAGYFVIDTPTGGSFAAGAATGGGVCTLSGAEAANTRAAGGRIETFAHNFTGLSTTRRLYGCDGVNPEFEFDGSVYVPIETGMGSRRATHVFVHKNHLFYSYGPSLQHSGTNEPYKWSPIFGAAELTTGDDATNLIGVAGSESSAALMVTCRDSVWVLYGNSAADWDFRKVSEEAGAQPYSGANFNGPITFDRDGFNRYSPTQSFGNFSYESASRDIDPLVRNGGVVASVLVKNKSKYRCFFSDGLFVTATPVKGGFAWMPCDYGRVINVAVGGEVDGQYRIFMGDEDGWVLEADVGRSFDGEEIESGIRLVSQNQKSPVTHKQYRTLEVQCEAQSAFRLSFSAEFSGNELEDSAITTPSGTSVREQYGAGLLWDYGAWDAAYWNGGESNSPSYRLDGAGRSVVLVFASSSDRELPHRLRVATLLYTPRRIVR